MKLFGRDPRPVDARPEPSWFARTPPQPSPRVFPEPGIPLADGRPNWWSTPRTTEEES